jgi:ADP-ribosylglycohydrolase
MSQKNILGCLLGTAVGDSIGLPYEGIPPQRASKMFGLADRHRFVLGRGMISDDTEHTCMIAQSLIASGFDVDLFTKNFAWRLRFWLLKLPAGTGMATMRAILKLWLGFPPHKSGVFSAGNGPAMRSAILGATIDDPQLLRQLVKASTTITHSDPKAELGAYAIALAAQMSRQNEIVSIDTYLNQLKEDLGPEGNELITLITSAANSSKKGESTEAFAISMGLTKGVSGYIYHTVPIALHAWFSHPRDIKMAIISVIKCGGDADTVAAIVGGIIGSAVGEEGIPKDWVSNIIEWPQSMNWIEKLSQQLNTIIITKSKKKPIKLPLWGILPRNFLFLIIVLLHGLRRLLPPY